MLNNETNFLLRYLQKNTYSYTNKTHSSNPQRSENAGRYSFLLICPDTFLYHTVTAQMMNKKTAKELLLSVTPPKLFRHLLCQLLPEDDLLKDVREEDNSIFLLISPTL